MIFECLLRLENPALRFKIAGDSLYIISGKEFIKADKNTGEIRKKAVIFPKDSKSRGFIIDEKSIYCKDFCELYQLDADTFEIISTWKPGSDLSSDICALGHDKENVYVSIRNGAFVVINKPSEQVKSYPISDSSIWDMLVFDHIYAGNVNGELIVIDKSNLEVLFRRKIHKKNLKSLLMFKDEIYTASQDLSISKINKNTFDIVDSHKRCHKKMFYFAGAWQDFLITVSPPCGETKFWSLSDLSLYKTIDRASWDSFIDGDILYEKDSNGIIRSDISDLITYE